MEQEERREKAVEFFRSGYNCAQSVFATYCDLFDVDESEAARIAAGFGAGIGRLQKTCGAVTGAVMIIGLLHYDQFDKAGSKTLVYESVREFIVRFEEKHESVDCLELLGVDLSTEGGAQTAKEEGLFETRCEKFVRDACAILEDRPISVLD
jgi:C_GCAxxG_C_C family probable redox protein